MSLVVLYEAGSDATYEDISDRFRNYTLDVTQNAEEGAVALSSVVIDDPTGDYEIKGYRRLAIYENAASAGSNSLLYNGFIVDRKVIRGPYRTGAGRQWVCSVADTNVVAEFRVMVGSDANRPAETDVARMQWLMSTSEMNRIPNTTFLSTSGPVQMDAVDYRGQKANDVLNDCAQASGKNHFTFAIDAPAAPLPSAPGATHIWYDFADSTARSSSIRLSNDVDDVEDDPYGLTYAIADDTELERDPSRVFSGAVVNYDGGMVIEEDLSISNEFTRRDAVVPAANIKTQAKATARALRYLDEMSTEEDRIRTAIRLPAARVNFVRHGMRVQFKATHLPGYESFSWLRVLRSTIKQDSEVEYLVTLELGTGPSTSGVPRNLLAIRCSDQGVASYFELSLVATVSGSPVTLIPNGATWDYLVGATGHTPGFEAPAFDDSTWASGAAQFGNGTGCAGYAPVTDWPLNTDLLVRKAVTVPVGTTALDLIFGVDNGAEIYWNGTLIHTVLASGCQVPNSYTRPVPSWS